MKKILVIESCPGTPHTDIALEILLREKESGSKVYYGLVFPHNGMWEYAHQYPQSSTLPLSGYIEENIHQICEKLTIPIVYPKNGKYQLDDNTWNALIIENQLFRDKWDLRTIITSTISALVTKTEPNLNSPEYIELAKQFSSIAINTYLSTLNLIDQINPDLIYFYNGRWASCKPIEWAAYDKNIKSLHHERGHDTNTFKLYEKPYYSFEETRRRVKKLASITDKDVLRMIGSTHYLNKQNRTETYWPSFTLNQERGILPDKLLGRKFVSYFSSSEDEFSQIPGNKIESYFGKQYQAFQILKSVLTQKKILLVVRVHPNVANKNNEESNFWNSQADENTLIFNATNSVDTYTLIENSSSIVSFATTVGLEAVFAGKPSILIGNSPWFNEPGFYCPKNIEELSEVLDSGKAKESEFVLAYGYYMEKFGEQLRYYKPTNFWSGKFLDHKIQPSPIGM